MDDMRLYKQNSTTEMVVNDEQLCRTEKMIVGGRD
jgi:hypothetical protein